MTGQAVVPPPVRSDGGAGRLASLDGLRGLAALIVVFHHLSLTLPPFSDTWIAPTAVHPAVGSVVWWFTSTPAELLIAGPEAVLVFFVLSGLVVALPVLRRRDFDWVAYYPQRLARLYLPAVASVVLSAIWIVLTSWSSKHPSSLWAAAYSFHLPTWKQVLGSSDLLFGDGALNNPLWTLRWEVAFSLLLPVFVVVAVIAARRWWFAVAGCVVVVVVGQYAGVGAMIFLPVFLVGTVVAVRFENIAGWVETHRSSRWWHWAGAGLLLASLALLNIHWTLWGALGGPPRLQGVALGVEFLGALGIVLLAAFWSPAVSLLSTAFFGWLGRISFSLYLVHVPVIIAMDRLFGPELPAARMVASLAVAIGVAELFSRFIERPAHRFSRWIGAASSHRVGEWRAARTAEAGPRTSGRIDPAP